MDKDGLFVWDGNYYALEVTRRLGVEETGRDGPRRRGPLQHAGRDRPLREIPGPDRQTLTYPHLEKGVSHLRETSADGGIGQRRDSEAGAFFHSSLRAANGRRGLFEHATIYRNRNGGGSEKTDRSRMRSPPSRGLSKRRPDEDCEALRRRVDWPGRSMCRRQRSDHGYREFRLRHIAPLPSTVTSSRVSRRWESLFFERAFDVRQADAQRFAGDDVQRRLIALEMHGRVAMDELGAGRQGGRRRGGLELVEGPERLGARRGRAVVVAVDDVAARTAPSGSPTSS